MTATVGIDMSLTSPGIACFWAGVWSLWCFATRKREENLRWQSADGTITLCVLPMIPGPALADAERYRHIITHIQRECVPHWPTDSRLLLEHYIFAKPSMSGSSYKLHELCGILKYHLTQTHPGLTTVAPSVWKKQLSGLSGLSKYQTLCLVQSKLPQLDLMKLFGFEATLVVPNPVQDLADAIGIVMASMTEDIHTFKTGKITNRIKKAKKDKIKKAKGDVVKKAKMNKKTCHTVTPLATIVRP